MHFTVEATRQKTEEEEISELFQNTRAALTDITRYW